jgi:diguanylate cyclase (GGDEF)-like protein/PAS domain S-box-containing protein
MPVLRVKRERKIEQMKKEGLVRGRQVGSSPREGDLHFRRLLEKLPAGAYTCDPEGLITYYNQHAVHLWGRAPKLNDPVDRFCGSFRLFSPDGSQIAHDRCWMALALKTNEGYNEREIVIERPDGRRLTALAHANPFHDQSGNLIGAVNVLIGISERQRAEEELERRVAERTAELAHANEELRHHIAERRVLERRLEHQASHDYLTNLLNQASFHEHLGRALARARRRGGKVALLYLDLDNFKVVNDSLGHQMGDRVLVAVAEHLKGCLRRADTAARLGGDEFVVLLEDVADQSEAVGIAERFLRPLRAPLDLREYQLYATASIGIAIGSEETPEELMRAADLAMYRAKSNGKAHTVVSDPSM